MAAEEAGLLILRFTGVVVNQPPSVPVLLSPSDGATVSPTPTFKLKATDPDGDNVKFRIEAKQGGITKVFETPFVASGAEATYTVPSNQALIDGQWTWKAKAIDQWGAESGWSQERSFTVKKDAPDLVPKDLVVNPTKVMPGGKVTVSVKVFNQGRVKASASKTRVRLSQSANAPSTSDPLLAEFNTPELNVNQYVTHSKEVTIPSDTQPGDYYVWVIVDADSTAGQSDETNDRIKVALKVEAAAPAGVIDVTVFDVSVNLDTGVINTTSPLSGITVILLKGGQQVASKKTGGDGKVRFEGQSAGDYIVEAFFADSQRGLIFRSQKSVTISESSSASTTLHLGVSLVRQIWDIKGKLERLKFSLYGFSFELPWIGYDTQRISEAATTLARDVTDSEKALQALERLLLASELSNRFLRDAESLSSELIGALVDIALVTWAALDLIGKVKETIRAISAGFEKWALEGLVNKIIEKIVWMHFKALSLALKLAKQEQLSVFVDEIARIVEEKANKGEAFKGKDYAIQSLGKAIISSELGMIISKLLYVSKTQGSLDMVAGWSKEGNFSGSWQGAYNQFTSFYTQIHRENEHTVQKSASLRGAAGFISRDTPLYSGNHKLAHIFGLAGA
ncbi:MAG: CARDB domain-containing protein, partial [Armatimonadota bacterium]